MEEVIETDKFYLSNPFFVPKSPANELKIISEGHVKLDEIKAENTVSFKIEPNIGPNGTETSIIIDPVVKNDFKGFNCDQCNRVFQHKSSLSVHKDGFRKDASNHLALKTINLHLGTVILKTKYKRSHSNHKPYQCNICGERFSQMNYLKNHQAVHADLQVQSDGIETSMPINDPSELNEMKNDEVQRKKKHECSICKHRTTSKADLERHKRTHTGEKPFKCDFCEKRYGRKEDLASHKRTHTGEKPFKCEFCDKAFIRKDKLTAHGLVHTGERPHECDRCGRRFARLDNLKAHYRK